LLDSLLQEIPYKNENGGPYGGLGLSTGQLKGADRRLDHSLGAQQGGLAVSTLQEIQTQGVKGALKTPGRNNIYSRKEAHVEAQGRK